MGARLSVLATAPAGHDVDLFDPYCEHLLVRLQGRDGEPGEVIGTYRVLTPANAKRVGGLYSETEFDLTRLRHLRGKMVELGRSCVHPDHRHGGAILALWGALAEFMVRNDLDTMIRLRQHQHARRRTRGSQPVGNSLSKTHLAPIELQVRPRLPLPVDELDRHLQVDPPAFDQGLPALWRQDLGAPAWDPDFNTADLPMLMRIQDLPPAIAAISWRLTRIEALNRRAGPRLRGMTSVSQIFPTLPPLPNHCRFGSC